MGIRFNCHHCQHELHVKDFQAGKRGRCPECGGRFRIPLSDAKHSLQLEEPATATAQTGSVRRDALQSATKAVVAPTLGSAVAASATDPTLASNTGVSTSDLTSDPTSDLVAELQTVAGELPHAIAAFPGAVWHVRPSSGGQYGPAESEMFGQWLREGRIDRQAWVWRDDWADWEAATVAFADYFSTSSLPPPPIDSATPHNGASPTAPVATTTGENPRRQRRLRQRQRNIFLVALLVVVFVGLLVTLAVVLLNQGDA